MFSRIKTRLFLFALLVLWPSLCISLSASNCHQQLAPERTAEQIERVHQQISFALGDKNAPDDLHDDKQSKSERYSSARLLASGSALSDDANIPTNHQLVYGELSVPVLAKLLDAVGVVKGDRFLDIGSGDGALVLGASLLFPDYIEESRGVELVPGLYERSRLHAEKLRETLLSDDRQEAAASLDHVSFHLGNIYEHESNSELSMIIADSSLAVCFATTWSLSNKEESEDRTSLDRRRLPLLSQALTGLPTGARIVVVDGRLDEANGHRWEGDLKIECPDTAPYSIASLYTRT